MYGNLADCLFLQRTKAALEHDPEKWTPVFRKELALRRVDTFRRQHRMPSRAAPKGGTFCFRVAGGCVREGARALAALNLAALNLAALNFAPLQPQVIAMTNSAASH